MLLAALSYLIVIFFCKDRNSFLFLRGYFFCGSLRRIAWVLRYHSSFNVYTRLFPLYAQVTRMPETGVDKNTATTLLSLEPPLSSSRPPDSGALASTPVFFCLHGRFSFASSLEIYLLLTHSTCTPQIHHVYFCV